MRRAEERCVVAGAGAGKTSWLVEYYLQRLEEGVDPARIVAITFTDKAAAQMRERIVSQVLEWGGAEELLARLELAPICTIHSFCVGILREFGGHVGLEPGFGILEEAEFSRLVELALEEVIAGELGESSEGIEELVEYLGPGPEALGELVKGLYLGLLSMGLGPSRAWELTLEAHRRVCSERLAFVQDAMQAVEELRQYRDAHRLPARTKSTQKALTLIELWPWEKGVVGLERGELEDLRELVKGNWASQLRPFAHRIRKGLEAAVSLKAAEVAMALTEKVLGLVRRVSDVVRQRMREVGGVSFAHQLLLTLELLESREDVLKLLRQRYELLLVDEFQDTDPLQARILGLLAALEGPPGPAPALVIVGDPAQSIYSFRGAQARIFAETARRLTQRGATITQRKHNYRSCRQLVEFFNSLFSRLGISSAAGMHQLGVDYIQNPAGPATALGGRAVEVVDLGEQKLNARQRRELEAQALARYVAGLMREEGVSPGRIAVLMPRLTSVKVYEQALERAGIAFYTLRGRGFFLAPEVRAMVAGMKALVEPADELALAGWLRSVFIGLDEQVLVALRMEGGSLRRGLVERECWPEWAGPRIRQRLELARKVVLGLGELAARMEPACLLEQLMDELDAEALAMATPAGEQAAANLRKLIEIVRATAPTIQGGTHGLLQWLCRQVREALDSSLPHPQAPLAGEEADVVRIMSVHQAKGLEFDVVLLVNLEGRGRSRSEGRLWLGPKGEVAFSLRDPYTARPLRPPLAEHLADLYTHQRNQENLRLFYVACTRAVRRLVFFLPPSPSKGTSNPRSSWAYWVRTHVLEDPLVRPLTLEDLPELPHPSPAPALSWREFLPPSPGTARPQAEELLRRCHSHPPGPRIVRTTISALEEWFVCPRRWWLVHRMGLDLATMGARWGGGQGRALVVGSILHGLLELADLEAGPRALDAVAQQVARASGATARELEQAMALARWWFSSPLKQMYASARKVDRELELVVRIEGPVALELRGAADLVVWREEEVVVVDYKVGRPEAEKYALQMRCYALALARASGLRPRAVLGFFQEGGLELVEVDVGGRRLRELEQRLEGVAVAMGDISPWVTIRELPEAGDCPRTCPARPLCRRPRR